MDILMKITIIDGTTALDRKIFWSNFEWYSKNCGKKWSIGIVAHQTSTEWSWCRGRIKESLEIRLKSLLDQSLMETPSDPSESSNEFGKLAIWIERTKINRIILCLFLLENFDIFSEQEWNFGFKVIFFLILMPIKLTSLFYRKQIFDNDKISIIDRIICKFHFIRFHNVIFILMGST